MDEENHLYTVAIIGSNNLSTYKYCYCFLFVSDFVHRRNVLEASECSEPAPSGRAADQLSTL